MSNRQPTLYLIVGLPGSGKTTKAKQIEVEHNALRLTPDEHIIEKYGHSLNRKERDSLRDPVEALQWQAAKQTLKNGRDVVIDFGFWSKVERTKFRKEAEELGARVKIIFMDADIDELWRRISQRPESKKGTLKMTRTDLEKSAKNFEPPTKEELGEVE